MSSHLTIERDRLKAELNQAIYSRDSARIERDRAERELEKLKAENENLRCLLLGKSNP